jgi:hypothetical protein
MFVRFRGCSLTRRLCTWISKKSYYAELGQGLTGYRFSQRMEASFVFARRHGEDLNVQNSIVQFWAEGYDVVVQSAVASNFEKAQKLQKPWLTIDTMAIFTKEQLIEVPSTMPRISPYDPLGG